MARVHGSWFDRRSETASRGGDSDAMTCFASMWFDQLHIAWFVVCGSIRDQNQFHMARVRGSRLRLGGGYVGGDRRTLIMCILACILVRTVN